MAQRDSGPGLNLPNAIVGVVALLLGVGVIAITPGQVGASSYAEAADLRAAGFFPLVAGALILAAGVASLIQYTAPRSGEDGGDGAWEPLRPLVGAGIAAVFVILLPWLGTFATMVPMMVGLSLLYRYPDMRIAVLVAVGVSAAIYLLFERVLLILFPHGWLF